MTLQTQDEAGDDMAGYKLNGRCSQTYIVFSIKNGSTEYFKSQKAVADFLHCNINNIKDVLVTGEAIKGYCIDIAF